MVQRHSDERETTAQGRKNIAFQQRIGLPVNAGKVSAHELTKKTVFRLVV